MLGLKLGLNMYKKVTSSAVDPILTAFQDANATMLLWGDRADGTNPGVNAPLTNPFTDLIGSNDATLVNFAGTTADGYDVPTGVNGQTMLKCDGVDSYCTIPNDASIDPTGTEDFAISAIFKTDSTLETGWLIFKGDSATTPLQFGIRLLSNGAIYLNIGASQYYSGAGDIIVDTLYEIIAYRISGTAKVILNEVTQINISNTDILTSEPNINILSLPSINQYSNIYLGYLSFFYNGSTGLNETKINTAHNLLKAEFGL